jgi:hypothetical protein
MDRWLTADMKTCLTCRHLVKSELAHEWYQCAWEAREAIPKSIQLIRVNVNPAAPFQDCAAWEEATLSGPDRRL